MNEKNVYLALAIIFTVMAIGANAWPVGILGIIYFYVFFTHDERQRKKEKERKKRTEIYFQKLKAEKKEKERIAKIKSAERMAELEKIRQKKLRKDAEEIRKAIKRQQFSYVYVLGNESMPGIVKIGYTDKEPMLRAIELSSATGIPMPFKVLKEYPFATLTRAQKEEKRLHSLFEKHRVNTNREFFRLSVNQVDREIRDNIKTKELSSATNVPTPFESEAFLSSNSPELEEKKRYTQLEKSRANYQQVEFREKESVNAGIYAIDPGANTAKYAFKCKACGKNFFSINPMNVSTVCPHCLKKP